MMKSLYFGAAALCAVTLTSPAVADSFCADSAQAEKIQAFYTENPGVMPVIAAGRLRLPEAIVVSGLAAGQSVSAVSNAFSDVWSSLTDWEEALFLIMKGANVFEVKSAAGPGQPSETSKYFNVEYKYPLRGHLRPDLYASIYAIEMPGETDGETNRGVIFFDANGDSVFGAFLSSDEPSPAPSEIAKFDATMQLINASPAVCAGK